MTVLELQRQLTLCDPTDIVKAYDGDSGQLEPITGILYGGEDHVVELLTDSQNE